MIQRPVSRCLTLHTPRQTKSVFAPHTDVVTRTPHSCVPNAVVKKMTTSPICLLLIVTNEITRLVFPPRKSGFNHPLKRRIIPALGLYPTITEGVSVLQPMCVFSAL